MELAVAARRQMVRSRLGRLSGHPGTAGRPDGERRRTLEGDGDEIRPCRTRSLAGRFALAHGPRHEQAARSDDGHGAEPQAWLPRLSEYRRGLPRSLRDLARGEGHSLNLRHQEWGGTICPATDARRIAMDSGGRVLHWTSEISRPNRRRRPGGLGGSAASRLNSDRMTEHELLRIIAFLER